MPSWTCSFPAALRACTRSKLLQPYLETESQPCVGSQIRLWKEVGDVLHSLRNLKNKKTKQNKRSLTSLSTHFLLPITVVSQSLSGWRVHRGIPVAHFTLTSLGAFEYGCRDGLGMEEANSIGLMSEVQW